MERLSVLEKKLALLIEAKKNDVQRIQELSLELDVQREENGKLREQVLTMQTSLQEEVTKLCEENTLFRSQIEKLEDALMARHQSIEVLNQEREMAKMALDDLIKTLDVIVEDEQPR